MGCPLTAPKHSNPRITSLPCIHYSIPDNQPIQRDKSNHHKSSLRSSRQQRLRGARLSCRAGDASSRSTEGELFPGAQRAKIYLETRRPPTAGLMRLADRIGERARSSPRPHAPRAPITLELAAKLFRPVVRRSPRGFAYSQ